MARNAHARYFAGREADVLALWDSPRQREAYDWFTIELGKSTHRISLGRRPSTTSTPQRAIAIYADVPRILVEQYEPIGWAEELIEPREGRRPPTAGAAVRDGDAVLCDGTDR